MFHSNWARYPGNTRFDLKVEITIELQNLYVASKGEKKNRWITADKAYDILLDAFIKYYWQQKNTLSVPKIKPFFYKTPAKMQDIIQGATDDIAKYDMEPMDIDDAKY